MAVSTAGNWELESAGVKAVMWADEKAVRSGVEWVALMAALKAEGRVAKMV